MNKIQKASYILHILFKLLCWVYPLVMIYFIFFQIDTMIEYGLMDKLISSSMIQNTDYSITHKTIIFLIQMIPMTIYLAIFHYLSKLFKLYQQGNLFELDNIKLIQKISLFMILGELIELIYQPLMTAALTFNNPPGQRLASITMGSTNLNTLLTAFIILVVSWIMKEAHQLKTDVQYTI